MLAAGDTFLLPKKSSQTEHLFIVLSDPDAQSKALCVNITTLQSHHEKTVLLSVGDHPFVKHDSIALYIDMEERDMAALAKLLAMKTSQFVCAQHASCTQQLLQRLRRGVIESPNVAKKVKLKYSAIWGIKYP
jgi:hypothetical protein